MTRGALAALSALAAIALAAAGAAAADLGPHSLSVDNTCRVCHNTALSEPRLRGWAGASLPDVSATAWAGRTISSLCYMCHTSGGGGFSATNQSANAYATGSHGFTVSAVPEEPDGSPQGTRYRPVSDTTLPYAKAAALECTSCHNVHRATDRPFLNRASLGALCDECHQGRLNTAPLRDTANTFGGTRSFSTHPTGVAIAANGNDIAVRTLADPGANPGVNVPYTSSGPYALGGHRVAAAGAASATAGNMDCGTCHAVHGVRQGSAAVADLLAIDNTTPSASATASRLCETCHYGGSAGQQVGSGVVQSGLPAGQWSDHPIDASTNRVFYPTAALPASWLKANTANKDRGAQPFYQAAQQTPVCSSCHDLHGGLAGTPLLRGPQPAGLWGAINYNDWCFACHPLAQVLPAAHHSTIQNLATSRGDPMNSLLGCGDCHGPAGTTNWKAHNGFWAWPAAYAYNSTSGAFCTACHTETNPADLVAPALKGQTFAEPASFPATHGTVRGTGSHYIGPDSNEFPGVAAKLTAWSTGYFSSYGAPNTGGGGNVAANLAGEIICQSCHSVLYNDGKAFPAHYNGSADTFGWKSNLLLERYEDDPPGTGDGATGGYAVNSALCVGCHDPATGIHHPLTGSTVTLAGNRTLITGAGSLADALGAPNTLSYPNVNALDCDSCHRPHRADSDSDVTGAAHGARTSTDGRPTRHILELVGPGNDQAPLCRSCHNS